MKLASVERITALAPIPAADSLELATVLAWNVVVKKGLYSVGDLCVFVPIDTTVDPSRECFQFVTNKRGAGRFKVETTKFKGVFSQGLILPLTCLEGEAVEQGLDVAAILGVEKYQKPASGASTAWSRAPPPSTPFPTAIIAKTDEDNLRTRPHVLAEFAGEESYITLKMDGSSLTIIYKLGQAEGAAEEFLICSRNCILAPDNVMYKYVEQAGIRDRLVAYGKNIAIQGEFCGPKINGNRIGLVDYAFYLFNVKDLDNGTYAGCDAVYATAAALGLTAVPLLHRMIIDEATTIESLQEIANGVKYVTAAGQEVPAEGIVIRPVVPKWSAALEKDLSVKIINQHYKD